MEINSPYRIERLVADQQAKDAPLVTSTTVWPASDIHNRTAARRQPDFKQSSGRWRSKDSPRRRLPRNPMCPLGKANRDSVWASRFGDLVTRTCHGSTEGVSVMCPIMPYNSSARSVYHHVGAMALAGWAATGRPAHSVDAPPLRRGAGAAGPPPRTEALSSAAASGVTPTVLPRAGKESGPAPAMCSSRNVTPSPAAGRAVQTGGRERRSVGGSNATATPRPAAVTASGSAATRRTPGPHRRAAALQHVVLAFSQAIPSAAPGSSGTVRYFDGAAAPEMIERRLRVSCRPHAL